MPLQIGDTRFHNGSGDRNTRGLNWPKWLACPVCERVGRDEPKSCYRTSPAADAGVRQPVEARAHFRHYQNTREGSKMVAGSIPARSAFGNITDGLAPLATPEG
jgi:hypothetical protein